MSIFDSVKGRRPRTNIFDLSHDRKFSMVMKELTPILCMECVPGDRVRLETSQMLRFAPMVAPPMHQVSCYTHFFFVPYRLLWPKEGENLGWQEFITGGPDGTSAPVFPTVTLNDANYANHKLMDYLGLPDPQGATEPVSAMPFAANTLIYNEFYRDQNLIPEFDYKLIDGDNDANLGDLARLFVRSWMHDYFTSALPWTQRGPEATIPLGTSADLDIISGTGLSYVPGSQSFVRRTDGNDFSAPSDDIGWERLASPNDDIAKVLANGANALLDTSQSVAIDPSKVNVDLSTATAATINELRQAFRLQEWLEKNGRGGSRYTEVILSHFGVRSPDARLQRPEFLGGAANPVSFSEVLQTSDAAAEDTPQGNMAGHGISVGSNKRINYFVQEHGLIMGYMSVMPKTAYFQGIPKYFFKFDKFDFFWPEFAHLGEQPILNKELFVDDDGENDDVFGYTPRYAEYKYIPSSVHGAFRTTLDFWHLARKFATRPYLNDQFLENSDDINRIFAVEGTDEQLYVHVFNSIKARRPMPYFGTPSF